MRILDLFSWLPAKEISIEEIENFIEIHEKYEVGFYDELKNNK